MTKVTVEIDLFNLSEIKKLLKGYHEFIEAVRLLRKAEKMYNKTRDEDNLSFMRSNQHKVDKLLKKYPKKR